MKKQGVDFFVYCPAERAGLHKAVAFGQAVYGITVSDELSALTETGVRIAVAITLRVQSEHRIYFTVSFRLNTFVPLATYSVLKSGPARMQVVNGCDLSTVGRTPHGRPVGSKI